MVQIYFVLTVINLIGFLGERDRSTHTVSHRVIFWEVLEVACLHSRQVIDLSGCFSCTGEIDLTCDHTFIGRMFMDMVAGRVEDSNSRGGYSPRSLGVGTSDVKPTEHRKGRTRAFCGVRESPTPCEHPPKAPAVSGPFTTTINRTKMCRTSTLSEACYTSGKEFVNHRTRVRTMYAPARDVELYILSETR